MSFQTIATQEKDGGNSLKFQNKRTQEPNGKVAATVNRNSEIQDTTQASAPLNTLADKSVRDGLADAIEKTIPIQPAVSDEVHELLLETDESGDSYVHPRHFAQLGNRSGFTMYVPTANEAGNIYTLPVTFENGVYTTTNVALVGALQLAIKRKDGIVSQIREISASHYSSIIEQARSYEKLRGVQGMVSTTDAKPFTSGRSPVELEQENENLRAQLIAMQEQAGAISQEAATDVSKDGNLFKSETE